MSAKVRDFLLLTFLLDWGAVAAFLALGGRWHTIPAMLFAVGYMLVPALAAVIVQKRYGETVKAPLGIRFTWNRWFSAAWLGPAVFALLTLGLGLLMPGVHFDPAMTDMIERLSASMGPEAAAQMRAQAAQMPLHPFWLGLLQGLVAGPTVNAVAAFGEELGWRGLLQREWASLGFWRSSLLIGVVWGLWHAPLIAQGHNYPEHPWLGIGLMTVFTLLLAPLFGYVRLKSGSVLAAAVAHGTLNAMAGIPVMVLAGGGDLLVGMTGLAGLIVLAGANLALWFADPDPDVTELES